MDKYDLAIIGAGASGLAAAINASRLHPGISIALAEHLPRAGKKILATGNGRCNMTNLNALSHPYRNFDFASFALNKYSPRKVIDFFASLGLYTYVDSEGRVYPRSNNASSVLDALRFSLGDNIRLIGDINISKACFKSGSFILNDSIVSDKLIIACGGKSSPVHGSDGSGYPLAKSFGHSIIPLLPSLTPLNINQSEIKSLKGVRASSVSLKLICGKNEYNSCGEILFTQTGISGIAAMELAAAAGREISSGNTPYLSIDYLPEYSENELRTIITGIIGHRGGNPPESLLSGLLPKLIGVSVLKKAGITGEYIKSDNISDTADKITREIKNSRYEITGTKGFADSQVTSGGIDTGEIDPETMQSKICKGLYFSGEIIDVDGGCGGFNLQWAFASGLLAGELNDQNQ